jgi:hypothetical protein
MNVTQFIGGLAFGLVIGWVTYFIIRRAQPKVLTDISTLIGIIGGGTITALFDPEKDSFWGYCIGLAIGFFAYYIVYLTIVGKHAVVEALMMKKTTQETGQAAADYAPMGPGKPATTVTRETTEEQVVWGATRQK